MSSLLRRIEIRSLKARGYARTDYRIQKDVLGRDRPVKVARGGLIVGPEPENRFIGYRWPRVIDLRREMPA